MYRILSFYKNFARIISSSLAVILIIYILMINLAPFGANDDFDFSNKGVSQLGPAQRVINTNVSSKISSDLVYTTSKMPFHYDRAKVKVIYKNPNPNQEIFFGYQDQNLWHYNVKTLDEPFMNNLKMIRVGNGPYLYEKENTYKTIEDFYNNPPKNSVLGVFDYSENDILQPNASIANYAPSSQMTSIDIPLRGKLVMYAYLKNEPFNMSITKKDINRIPDPDTVKISVFKGSTKVYDATIDDDGNNTDNQHAGPPQTIKIKNPGPGLPETGVYKIVFDTTGDVIFSNITTNLHKLVFEGPINPIASALVYPRLVHQTKPTDIYTNASNLTAKTFHTQSLQTITACNKQTKINSVEEPVNISVGGSCQDLVKITSPINDITYNGIGYFAFNPDQFFQPSPYKILPINDSDDVSHSDFILTNYPGAKSTNNGWKETDLDFNLKDGVVKKSKLSWLIHAPGLKENKGRIEVKNIEFKLTKDRWWKNDQ
jgi:hypothetical protein